ncbi:methionine synthase [Candidatus Marinamargulisbacteria bacterium SCGC AG-410-N11]|nr:methionine synthase [Candidatus Marinamargulisbacteria bacterium SCGC AG-410-N11]
MIQQLINEKILVIDGAMGTALQDQQLTADDFGGEEYEGCNEYLVISKPEAVQKVHEQYLASGADIVETNTFGGTPFVLGEYQLQDKVEIINKEAVKIARKACDKYSTPEKPRFVAGSVGPTTKSLSVTGGISFDELSNEFYIQIKALVEAGVDYLLLETALDTLNLKASYIAILKVFDELSINIPIAISGTIETMGTMLAGQTAEAFYTSVEHMDLLYIGLNCATGPEFMRDHIRTLSRISRFPIAVVPNAGIPDEDGNYPESPDDVAKVLSSFIDEKWVNIVGGCCGTTPAHINTLSELANKSVTRKIEFEPISRLSGIETLLIEPESGPYIVGERTNVIGSRMFKRLITEGKWDEAAEIARKQVKAGAHIIDICVSNPDRDEVADMKDFLSKISKMVKVPLMIDTQVPEVAEEAFKLIQGKCILNSVNLEEGEKYFQELLPIVKQYGASVVVGCIRGEMAVTAKDKLDVALESYDLLTNKYGIEPEDIYFDPLVFPCGTGDENYFGSGKETIEGVRLITEALPRCKSTLGISNVSFGLPPAGREVLNSVFMYHCTQAGLTTAIVNSQGLVRYSTITDEEKKLCDDLIWYRTENGNDPIANFVAYFRDKKKSSEQEVDLSSLPFDKRLERNIVEGTKEFLTDSLDEALKTMKPLAVINGPLMVGMNIVGDLFNRNELIVAEVLQSAEVMKTAVSHLEQFMEKKEENIKGKMILATVKGDVHDIGKNLVQIILGNNGYEVIDLGIKCPPDVLIEAVKKHKPDMIGLSGLLVKSAQQMVITAKDLKSNGIDTPILVGGAALTANFTNLRIAPEYSGPVIYAKDAMSGLSIANELVNKETRDEWLSKFKASQQLAIEESSQKPEKPKRDIKEKIIFDHDNIQAKVSSFEVKKLECSLGDFWNFINPQMLYGHHLGLKGKVTKKIQEKDEKAMKLYDMIERLKLDIIQQKLLTAKAVYRFFKVRAEDDKLIILDHQTEKEKMVFRFPRQSGGYRFCLTDFVKPNAIDTVCFFVVTCGEGISNLAQEYMKNGNYFDAHGLQAIALESAEGFSEFLHQRIRKEWNIPDMPGNSPQDLFKLKYSGVRVSFGYPACPRLEDQGKLWELLTPDDAIGVTLSEDFMMVPEASVSALCFHHPQARYFSIDDDDLALFEANL